MPHTFYTQTHTQKLSVIFDRSKNDAKDSPILCTLSYIFFFAYGGKKRILATFYIRFGFQELFMNLHLSSTCVEFSLHFIFFKFYILFN